MKTAERKKLESLLELCDDELKSHEVAFIDSIDRDDRTREGTLILSPAQSRWLSALHERHSK